MFNDLRTTLDPESTKHYQLQSIDGIPTYKHVNNKKLSSIFSNNLKLVSAENPKGLVFIKIIVQNPNKIKHEAPSITMTIYHRSAQNGKKYIRNLKLPSSIAIDGL